jgi:hypothetical protein
MVALQSYRLAYKSAADVRLTERSDRTGQSLLDDPRAVVVVDASRRVVPSNETGSERDDPHPV